MSLPGSVTFLQWLVPLSPYCYKVAKHSGSLKLRPGPAASPGFLRLPSALYAAVPRPYLVSHPSPVVMAGCRLLALPRQGQCFSFPAFLSLVPSSPLLCGGCEAPAPPQIQSPASPATRIIIFWISSLRKALACWAR